MYGRVFSQHIVSVGLAVGLVLVVAGVSHASIDSPANGAVVSGTTPVTLSLYPAVQWANFYIDGAYEASTPPSTWEWDTTGWANGTHTISANAYNSSFQLIGQASITVIVANGSGSGGQVPGGATIPGMTGGNPGGLAWDTNSADDGQYTIGTHGFGIMGGPLETDVTAWQHVKATAKSAIENGPNGYANAQENNYFNAIASNNPNDYVNQVNAFTSAFLSLGGNWYNLMRRVDGACPMANPTTAEVLQWGGHKWGINPLFLYAEVTTESSWDQAGIGDNGGSSGLFQVPDRGADHAMTGFAGYGQNLARENTCFNVDLYCAIQVGTYMGITGRAPAGNIDATIESWYTGHSTSGGGYESDIIGFMGGQQWVTWYFGGQAVPY